MWHRYVRSKAPLETLLRYRARCELRAAVFGLELLKEASNFEDMDDVFLAAEDI